MSLSFFAVLTAHCDIATCAIEAWQSPVALRKTRQHSDGKFQVTSYFLPWSVASCAAARLPSALPLLAQRLTIPIFDRALHRVPVELSDMNEFLKRRNGVFAEGAFGQR